MHLKAATSTHSQPHNEQDMGFSMLSQSGRRSFPVSNYADSRVPVKNIKLMLIEKLEQIFHIQNTDFFRKLSSVLQKGGRHNRMHFIG